jgi:hypothetical protein
VIPHSTFDRPPRSVDGEAVSGSAGAGRVRPCARLGPLPRPPLSWQAAEATIHTPYIWAWARLAAGGDHARELGGHIALVHQRAREEELDLPLRRLRVLRAVHAYRKHQSVPIQEFPY